MQARLNKMEVFLGEGSHIINTSQQVIANNRKIYTMMRSLVLSVFHSLPSSHLFNVSKFNFIVLLVQGYHLLGTL